MAPVYDPTSDTFQVPTERYLRERGFLVVTIPDWDPIPTDDDDLN